MIPYYTCRCISECHRYCTRSGDNRAQSKRGLIDEQDTEKLREVALAVLQPWFAPWFALFYQKKLEMQNIRSTSRSTSQELTTQHRRATCRGWTPKNGVILQSTRLHLAKPYLANDWFTKQEGYSLLPAGPTVGTVLAFLKTEAVAGLPRTFVFCRLLGLGFTWIGTASDGWKAWQTAGKESKLEVQHIKFWSINPTVGIYNIYVYYTVSHAVWFPSTATATEFVYWFHSFTESFSGHPMHDESSLMIVLLNKEGQYHSAHDYPERCTCTSFQPLAWFPDIPDTVVLKF